MQSLRLIQWLLLLSVIVLLVIYGFDVIYLPQQKLLQEQQASLASLEHQMSALKLSPTSARGKTEAFEQARLWRHVYALEEAVRLIAKRAPAASLEGEVKALLESDTDAAKPLAIADGGGTSPDSVVAAVEGSVYQASTAGTSAAVASAPAAAPAREAAAPRRWRDDSQCGSAFPLPDGKPSQCDPRGDFPCCAASGWCGSTPEHCTCASCTDFRQTLSEEQATLQEYSETSPKAVALIIPFRDRGVHLERFRERIQSHIEAWSSKVNHTWEVFVVEQFDNELFNRGYLFNVGFRLAQDHAKKVGRSFDCVVMHDIDIIPLPVADYGWCVYPNQIAGEIECWGWSVPYKDNVGGVVSLSPQHWERINGFSNEYQGWGGEDDDLYLRLKQNRLLKGGCHTFCKDKGAKVEMIYRPPLGQGKFTCLHDGDHTPRQRNSDDRAMWSRLKAMQSGSKQWQSDGIKNSDYHQAGPALQVQACSTCSPSSEDSSAWRFGELWARVSKKPIPKPARIRVVLERCPNRSHVLPEIPSGLGRLRELVQALFPSDGGPCGIDALAAKFANFVLLDVTQGQAWMVGQDALSVIPDTVGDGAMSGPAFQNMVQSQRLSRWIRKLPLDHEGLIYVLDEPLAALRERLERDGQVRPQVVPACIATATVEQSKKKYRITPGTTWCGDGGWQSGENFLMLHHTEGIAKEDIVPLCISFNEDGYAYRFEKSERGCAAKHEDSNTKWRYAQTIHTLKKATGDRMCVGMVAAGPKTRWVIMKSERCTGVGVEHKFSFRAMEPEVAPKPFASACILVAKGEENLVTGKRRLAHKEQCRAAMNAESSKDWIVEHSLLLLSKRASPKDQRICAASLEKRESEGDKVHRIFKDDRCKKDKVVLRNGMQKNSTKMTWSVDLSTALYTPANASGLRVCLCKAEASQSITSPFVWTTRSCKEIPSYTKDFCFRSMTVKDMMQYVHVLDEVL
eukprot:TRINITY_DN26763_c0_g1_i1.p1 TRINITY_DN26763_c0_g1~~TRINITY_DN26763_c0_g1_i1.p1  ORF type:complete len:965 (-),score=211.78 TRINITY_DN26763_c0_g1_i1:150-3044(-)